MFKNTYQNGFVSVLYAGGSKPLAIWGQVVKNGHIRRVTDEDVQTMALEVMGTNVATTYIVCPADAKNILGIKLPFFVMIVKNMKKYFSFEIQILDDKGMSRRFRVSNYQSATRVRPFSTSLPIGLTGGWNQIQFNLADFTRRAYGSCYLETLRVQIHANVRIRRIYFCDRLYSEDELPADFKLYVPITTQKKGKPGAKGAAAAGKDVKILEDKSTGKDDRRLSKLSEKSAEKLPQEVPSGALPTPREGSIAEMPKIAEKGDGAFEEGVESQPPGQFTEEEEFFDEEDHEELDFSLAPSAVDDEYVMIETNTEVGEGEGGGEETTRADANTSADEGTATDAEAPSTVEEEEEEE